MWQGLEFRSVEKRARHFKLGEKPEERWESMWAHDTVCMYGVGNGEAKKLQVKPMGENFKCHAMTLLYF